MCMYVCIRLAVFWARNSFSQDYLAQESIVYLLDALQYVYIFYGCAFVRFCRRMYIYIFSQPPYSLGAN